VGIMLPSFTYPLWTPHTFADGALRWVLDEPVGHRAIAGR
jgi:hypothetical protein